MVRFIDLSENSTQMVMERLILMNSKKCFLTFKMELSMTITLTMKKNGIIQHMEYNNNSLKKTTTLQEYP
jgi:predicted rRNA methylase YqxC with S4 and FtsJ domains